MASSIIMVVVVTLNLSLLVWCMFCFIPLFLWCFKVLMNMHTSSHLLTHTGNAGRVQKKTQTHKLRRHLFSNMFKGPRISDNLNWSKLQTAYLIFSTMYKLADIYIQFQRNKLEEKVLIVLYDLSCQKLWSVKNIWCPKILGAFALNILDTIWK